MSIYRCKGICGKMKVACATLLLGVFGVGTAFAQTPEFYEATSSVSIDAGQSNSNTAAALVAQYSGTGQPVSFSNESFSFGEEYDGGPMVVTGSASARSAFSQASDERQRLDQQHHLRPGSSAVR